MLAKPNSSDTLKNKLQSPPGLRLTSMVLMSLAAGVLFVVYLSLALQVLQAPFLGTTINHTMTVNASVSNADTPWTGREAGLRPGDQIIALDDIPLEESQPEADSARHYLSVLDDFDSGDVVTVTFRYDAVQYPEPREDGVLCNAPNADGQSTCQVDVELMSWPEIDFIAYFVLPFGTGLIVLGIVAFLIVLRPYQPNTFLATAGLLPLALVMGSIFDVGSSHTLVPVWLVTGVWFGTAMVTIGMLFPTPLPILVRQPWLRWLPAVIGLAIVALTLDAYRSSQAIPLPLANQIAVASAITGLAIMAALVGFYQRPNATNALKRDQANVLLMGILLSLSPAVLWLMGRVFPDSPMFAVSIEATMPFLITVAISLAYSVLQYQAFDTERVLSQSITYLILLIALGLGYALLILGATLITADTVRADNPLLIVITVFFVSLLFVPLRTALQRRIDGIYFRTRHDYQARLETFSQKLTSLAGANVMIESFRNLLSETIKPINAIIYLRDYQTGSYIAYGDPEPQTDIIFAQDSGVIRLLSTTDNAIYLQPGQPWPPELQVDRARLNIIKVMILVGMAGADTLNGFVAIGPPQSKANSYKYEELRFVQNLTGQLAIAIERATVFQSMQRSYRELEVLSQVSQAVNFTIEISDLLELISAQTLKLIQAPYFYTVLHDTATDQIYYAFFLENDERYPDIENRKWAIDQDLYSQVLRTGQPMRVDKYADAMARGNYRYANENPNTQAWMAVPLIAGARTLGVMAVGESNPERRYSLEQLKIFSDIGSLAAASLDKARLFSEANARARQLAVLNDISRQLVATEGDVERLLDLITQSAVEILNAEAGSLLLTVDDGSGDLEFKVAVGQASEELIGKRLEANFGLVGQVAATGRPVISNDTTSDDSWQSEVVEEGFQTRSVLAVPLIAKDRIIGVLEVINKRDGSIYVEEEMELLTTFAGQAAIAFENARLFQQTDLQLEQRVQQLEALERIDRELNRNLDLYNVAEITVRWAVNNSNATAGLLGIVTDDRAYLRVVASIGYETDDAPEGAARNLWPTDRGIVSRVIRTRRADLQPYVGMDPDYVPSLRGALSQITIPMLSADDINAILIVETDREPRLNLLDQDWIQRLTEHASIAIENAQLYAELTRANETKSEFMGFAAHELKNPLTSVMGYASALQGSMAAAMSTDQIQSSAQIIQSNAERMESIISDLRDIAASDANKLEIKPEPISFYRVVMDTLLSLQKQIDSKGQTVINRVTDDLPLVMADAKRMIQVMVNFLSNANKYSPREATLTIDAIVKRRYVNRKGNSIGDVLHIMVTDTGIGMSDEDLQRIFNEDYFRSENEAARAEKGTGLGMMITKRLIDDHGGEVWVESRLGEGSTFHFVVPLAPESQQHRSQAHIQNSTREPEASAD